MSEEQAAHHLLNVLEERGLDVDLDKILLGFEDEETKGEAAAWVHEYLNEETLLTKEELELYQTLKRKGLSHQYESEGEPSRPILDHEIAAAIESLQSSTTAIEEQCRVLEMQRAALMKLKALDKPNLDIEHARNERRRKEGQEKARLDVAIDDVSTAITEQLADARREIDSEKSALKSYVAERLSSDDQILSRLPNIVSTIVTEPEFSEDEKSMEQWCKAIIAFRTAEIKARVDAVYLNSLSEKTNGHLASGSVAELQQLKDALQAEMEELHAEVASIAEMVVEHELRKPMLNVKQRKEKDRTLARTAWLNYVLSTLDYMGKRLDIVRASSTDVDEFRQAIAHVEEAASKRMPDVHAPRPTPVKRRTSSVPLSAFTPMTKLKPTTPLGLPAALQDALRYAGVSFHQDTLEGLQDTLVRTRAEREKKGQDHFQATATATHEQVAERSSRADGDVRIIMDALYAHTPFQQVSLTNPKLEAQLKAMGRELDDKDRELLDAEGNELSLSDPRVRAFVAKYGRQGR
ncbi:uncharacterized protein M421DRAFT_102468 [Didymella exigua CBS 183.55]|uniref:HAUS augmin-like complex subunit 3 N-terminal domain-containing protein n=1 Tax=Didymella exigua CBS 183.55 TaxID=1150837 RepID=A0A6A5RFC0_9PLEO|nr:uncharacterized protein M421DRAFT_102468 [Didymella exigua CBS 183.55]KAF1926412.1 hypothetical protein M421DRAFT_102468 [Didymella exigua CBS 183.55]